MNAHAIQTIEWFRAKFDFGPEEPLTLTTLLVEDLGLDSLQMYEIALDVSELYSTPLSEDMLYGLRSIGDIVHWVELSLSGADGVPPT